jgi:hypothetical protein
MITEDRVKDVAKAIEQAHYPTSNNVTGQAFMGDARTFIAALNAAEAIAKDTGEAPKEFGFDGEALSGWSPPEVYPPVAAKAVLTFTAQPKDGDGFSIGKTRYEFHAAARPTMTTSDIVIGADLPATIKATLLAINGVATGPVTFTGDLMVTAIPSAPDAITITAKEHGEPLLPVQTVAWSKMLTAEEKAVADRTATVDARYKANPDAPLTVNQREGIGQEQRLAQQRAREGVGIGASPLRPPGAFRPDLAPPLPNGQSAPALTSGTVADPTAPPPPFMPPPNVAPDPDPAPSTFAPSSPPPLTPPLSTQPPGGAAAPM